MGDSAGEHMSEIESLKGRMGEHDKLHGLFENMQDSHSGVQERLSFLEQTVGDSAAKHAKELGALEHAHGDHKNMSAKELKSLESGMAAHASVGEGCTTQGDGATGGHVWKACGHGRPDGIP